MHSHELLALVLDPARLLEAQGITPDPWQRKLLLAPAQSDPLPGGSCTL
jgi:hypothetical protein